MNKAYYWYRPIPYYSEFYPGKILNAISDPRLYLKYLSDISTLELAKKFFPNGLSPHGLQTLSNYEMASSNINEPITEIIFELVRQLHFSDSPSRLSSLYASKSISQAKQWQQLWIENLGNQKEQIGQSLWEIEFKTRIIRPYDAQLLYIGPNNDFSYLVSLENAHMYWKHIFTQNPLPELLIPYPVTVTRLIQDTDTE